jgi:hypothetical protein
MDNNKDDGLMVVIKILGGIIVSVISFGAFAWFAGLWTFSLISVVGVLIIWKLDSTVGWTTIAMAFLSILAFAAG